MSGENDRRFQRFLTELDLVLAQAGGAVIDEHAQAHDISPRGFRIETRTRLAEGSKVAFEMTLGNGDRVKGTAEIVWVGQNQWGACLAGAKITRISWRDSGRLKQAIYRPGFDFVGLARKAFWGLYVVIVVVALQNVVLEESMTRELIWKLAPVIGALVALGWSLLVLLG